MAYLAKMGTVKAHIVLTPKTLPDAESYNVIADLKGSEKPDEVVIVSGHLDSWDLGTGALDDACGVGVSMQVANLLKQLKMRPKRTIRVIAWMNEENGSRGSNAYFEEQKGNLAKHFAAMESDLGASHPLGIFFTAKPEVQAFLAPISNVLLSQGAGLVQCSRAALGLTSVRSRREASRRSPRFLTRRLILSIIIRLPTPWIRSSRGNLPSPRRLWRSWRMAWRTWSSRFRGEKRRRSCLKSL